MHTVPCDTLAWKCLRINLCRGHGYACIGEYALPGSQVGSYLQRHVESRNTLVVNSLDKTKASNSSSKEENYLWHIRRFHRAHMGQSIP